MSSMAYLGSRRSSYLVYAIYSGAAIYLCLAVGFDKCWICLV